MRTRIGRISTTVTTTEADASAVGVGCTLKIAHLTARIDSGTTMHATAMANAIQVNPRRIGSAT